MTADKINVTVDADAPTISGVNISDSNTTLTAAELTSAGFTWVKLANIDFNVTINDPLGDIVNASVYYNISNSTTPLSAMTIMPHPNNPGSYDDNVVLTSSDSNRYNGTLASSALFNGSTVYFVVVANDSVGNINLSNHTDDTVTVSAYNFTVDGAAPLVSFNGNLFSGFYGGISYNLSQSSDVINISVKADDSSGSGVKFVTVSSSDAPGTEIPLNLTNDNADGSFKIGLKSLNKIPFLGKSGYSAILAFKFMIVYFLG